MTTLMSTFYCYILETYGRFVPFSTNPSRADTKHFRQAVSACVFILMAVLTGQRANASQSYTIFLPAEMNLIANQLNSGNNSLTNVFPLGTLPDGTEIQIWNCSSFDTYFADSSSSSGWDDSGSNPTNVSGVILNPGKAFFIFPASPISVVFTGTPNVPTLPATLPCGYGQTNYLSCQTNTVGNYTNIIGLIPAQGSQEQIWNGTQFSVYTFTNGAWAPATPPALAVGQGAVFIVPATAPSSNNLFLQIARTNSNVVLIWSNTPAFELQSSLALTGTWSFITGAISPWVVSPTNPSDFFRLATVGSNPPASFAALYVAPTFSSSIGNPFGCGCVSPENPNTLGTVGGAQDNGMGSVLLETGELTQDSISMEIPGRGINWRFEMRYRSGMSYAGPVGGSWDFNYNRRLAVETNGDALCVSLGRADRYTHNGDGSFTSPAGFFTVLKRHGDGTYAEIDHHGSTNTYSATNSLGIAQLSGITDRYGNQMTFQYNTASQLTNVVDTLGRSITYNYDTNGRLTTVTDFAGRALSFTYDSQGDLTSMTSPAVTNTPDGNDFPSGKTTRYTYSSGFSDPRFNHNLLTVTSPNEVAVAGPPRLVAQYDTDSLSTNAGRLVSLTIGGTNAGGPMSFAYESFGPVGNSDYATPVFQNTVTNRNSNVTQYKFNQLGDVVSMIQFTRGIRAGDPAAYTNTFGYNGDGLLIGQTNAEQSVVQFVYDSANSNRLAQSDQLQIISLPGPRGGDQAQLITSKTYEPNFNFPNSGTDARGDTFTCKFDAKGNITNVVHRLSSIVDDYTFNSSGQMLTHTWPDNGGNHRRLDTLTYYSSGPQAGYLQQSNADSGGLNLTTTYQYDAAGNVTRTIDPRGNDTLFIVNALNQVVQSSSPAVSTTNGLVRYQQSYFYDADNNLIRTDTQNIDDGGNVVAALPTLTTTNAYDVLDQLIANSQQVSSNHYAITTYQYDADGNRTLVGSAVATSGLQSNNVVTTHYDERDMVFQSIRAPNDSHHSTTQLDYDGEGNTIRLSEGLEDGGAVRVSTYTMDGYHRPTTVTDPMGNITTYHYDANGNVASTLVDGELVDVPGSTNNVRLSSVTYTYDADDRMTRSDTALFDTDTQTNIGAGDVVTSIAYNDNSQVVTNSDANTNITTTTYDTANRVSVVTDAKSNTVTYAYDADNNVTLKTAVDLADLGGLSQTIRTTNVYDAMDRLVQITDNAGNQKDFGYDSRNNQLSYTDPRGNLTRYGYDGMDRLITTTGYLTDTGVGSGNPAGSIVTSQNWDDNSRLTGQTDANSNTTVYVYDSLNRMVETVFADGTSNSVSYDVHGNVVSDSDPNLNLVSTSYDLDNRPTAKTIVLGPGVSGTTNESYQYDGLSRVVSASNGDSAVTRSYDSLSRCTSETQQVLPGGTAQTVALSYDGNGNVLSCTYPGGRLLNYTYSPLNQLQIVTNSSGLIAQYYYYGRRRVQNRTYGNNTTASYTYDAIRRMTNSMQSVIGLGTPIDSRAYGWDAAGNQTSDTDLLLPALDARSFSYDSADRLVQSITAVVGPTNAFSLDGVGNRLTVTSGTNVGNYFMNSAVPPADFQMNQYSTTPFDTRTNDANGNLTAAGSETLSYNYRNEMIAVNGSNQIFAAKYDCFGRRIQKSSATSTNRYYYAGWQEIEEQDATNSTVATYVWGKGVDELLTMTRGGQQLFYYADELGSIRKVADGSGSLVEQYRYDDYGQPTFLNATGAVIASSQITNSTLFTGRRYDTETGFYHYRTRYLDPLVGRFTTRDTIGIWGDPSELGNGFTYVGNNPASMTDPTGQEMTGGGGTATKGVAKTSCRHHFLWWHWDCFTFTPLQPDTCTMPPLDDAEDPPFCPPSPPPIVVGNFNKNPLNLSGSSGSTGYGAALSEPVPNINLTPATPTGNGITFSGGLSASSFAVAQGSTKAPAAAMSSQHIQIAAVAGPLQSEQKQIDAASISLATTIVANVLPQNGTPQSGGLVFDPNYPPQRFRHGGWLAYTGPGGTSLTADTPQGADLMSYKPCRGPNCPTTQGGTHPQLQQ